MAKIGIGIDIGTHTIKVVEGRDKGGAFEVTHASCVPIKGDPAQALRSVLERWKPRAKDVTLGITGKDLMMRYTQVPPVPDWQLLEMMDFEIQEIRSQSGEDLAADFNLLPVSSELTGEDIALLALAKEGYIAPLRDAVQENKLKVGYFTPNSVAIYNAFAKVGPEVSGVTMLLNLGAQNSDIAILRDQDLIFARNVSTGGSVFNEALVEAFNVSDAKAEKLKIEMGDLRPRDARRGQSPQESKVSAALEGSAGQIFSLVRSTLMLAKSQLKLQELELDQVFLCGGTASMSGIADYLQANLGVGVETFDALDQVTVLDEEVDVEEIGLATTPALGASMMAVYSDLYSLEVLPAAERKKRHFQKTTLFSILAIVLVVAYLGVDAMKSKERYEAAVADGATIRAAAKKRERQKKKFDQLILEREELSEKVSVLETYREGGLGLTAVLGAIQKHLPPELWVRSITIENSDRETVPGEKRPAVVVSGNGQESKRGDSLSSIFGGFHAALAAERGVGEVIPQPNATGGKFEFMLTVFPADFSTPDI